MLDNAKLYSSTMTELGSLLKRLCEDAAGIIGTEASSIFLREDNHFVMRAAYGYSAPLVDKAIYAPGEGLTGWIGLGNRFIANSPEEVRQHPSWLGKYDTQTQQQRKTINTFRGLIAVPLLSEKTIIGLIKVENKISGLFTDEDVTRLGIYARNATAFIETKKEAIAVMKGMYIFVLMPFADEFNDIYKFGIKQCIDQMGMKCERVDQRHFTRGILQEIYRCIERANYIVADITGKNPNVFYEVGYAHALKKDVILLVQDEEDVPFNLHDMNHINYGGSIDRLSNLLRARLEGMISGEYATNP